LLEAQEQLAEQQQAFPGAFEDQEYTYLVINLFPV